MLSIQKENIKKSKFNLNLVIYLIREQKKNYVFEMGVKMILMLLLYNDCYILWIL